METKVEVIRTALTQFGPKTAKELAELTGFHLHHVAGLMARDVSANRIVKYTVNKTMHYRIANERDKHVKSFSRPVRLVMESGYWSLAERARRLEQAKKFNQAAAIWQKAERMTKPASQYCANRAAFCINAHARGWGLPDGSPRHMGGAG